jgi:hypothetical protein
MKGVTNKAITLTAPWGSFVMNGWKRWETRPTISHYRGPFWIAAGASTPAALAPLVRSERMQTLIQQAGFSKDNPLPKGCLLGIVELQDCRDAEEAAELILEQYDSNTKIARELFLGGYGPGRFAYKLEVLRILKKPIPCKGKQGWWFVPQPILDALTDDDFILS